MTMMGRRRMRGVLYVLSACVCINLPAASWSQEDFIQSYFNLGADDLRLLSEAGRSLYVDKRPAVLDRAAWESEASGASGTVRIVEASADGSCIVLRHEYKEGAEEPEKSLDLKRCKASNGDWLISQE